jgi:queuosine precursor transporter
MYNELLFFLTIIIITTSIGTAAKYGEQALFGLIIIMGILANIFVTKQITLFGFYATATDALAVGITLGYNLIQELYSKKAAYNLFKINIFCVIITLILIYIQVLYTPSNFDHMQPHIAIVFGALPRTIIASYSTYFIVQWFDIFLYSMLKNLFGERFFTLRNIISMSTSHLLDTILFTILALWGVCAHLEQIIVISYTIKLVTIIAQSSLMGAIKKAFIHE